MLEDVEVEVVADPLRWRLAQAAFASTSRPCHVGLTPRWASPNAEACVARMRTQDRRPAPKPPA